MGSKRWMLSNGLGHLLVEKGETAHRFVDLFAGTAAVSWHVGRNLPIPVLAVDLQAYSEVLARSVLARTAALTDKKLLSSWIGTARRIALENNLSEHFKDFSPNKLAARDVWEARDICGRSEGLITKSYGGFYFSPQQVISIDALMATLPLDEPERSVCLSSLIGAATRCAASPGHTAQPFQPTQSALPFIRESWARDPFSTCAEIFTTISSNYAMRLGQGLVGDALDVASREINRNDLVFVDPPYSAVQYSRFYHVLETIARGKCGQVEGGGRYPPFAERPRSRFSLKTEATNALQELLETLGNRRCEVIMTFPQYGCSNGIIGENIPALASPHFSVDIKVVPMRHSTMGGNNSGRSSRRQAMELVLCMKPR